MEESFEDFLKALIGATEQEKSEPNLTANMNGPDHYKAANKFLYDAEESYELALRANAVEAIMPALQLNLELVKAHSLQAQAFAALESAAATVTHTQDKIHRATHDSMYATFTSVSAMLTAMQENLSDVIKRMRDNPETAAMEMDTDKPFEEAVTNAVLEYIKGNIEHAQTLMHRVESLADSIDVSNVDIMTVTPDMSPEDVSAEVQRRVAEFRDKTPDPYPHASKLDADSLSVDIKHPVKLEPSDFIEGDENESRGL